MPFDFTLAMRRLMEDITANCRALGHIEMSRVAVGFGQTRTARLSGIYAQVFPLRFPGGARRMRRGQAVFEMPVLTLDGREALYLVKFMLPRFLQVSFPEKIGTVFHEMYHISPRFDGTLRTFPGRRPYHTGSRRRYDRFVGSLAQEYLASTSRHDLHQFLKKNFEQLGAEHGGVVGIRYRNPNPYRIA